MGRRRIRNPISGLTKLHPNLVKVNRLFRSAAHPVLSAPSASEVQCKMKPRRTVEEAFFQNVGGDKIRRGEPPLGEVAGLLPNK